MVKRIDFGNDVLPPTAAGQIPIAQPNGNNRLVYGPTVAALPTPQTGDAGKVLAIDTVTATGITYKYEALSPIDPLVLSIYNQNGLLFAGNQNNSNHLRASIASSGTDITLNGTATAVFYNDATLTRTTRNLGNATIPITMTGDSTYVFVNPDGTFGQVHSTTDPTDFDTVNYLYKVYHPGSRFISSIKPIYTILNTPQENLRDFGYGLGIQAQNFNITYMPANNQINQASPYAVVSGYNINPTDNMPSQKVFIVANGFSFQYWSWNAADRVPSTNTLARSYKVDSPGAATSTALAAGQFGTLVLFAGSDGSYIMMAPQKAYTSIADAQVDVLNYVASVIQPQLITEQYDSIAAFIVPTTVAANTAVTVIMLNSIVAGGAPADDALPDPTKDGVVKVLPGSNAYSIETDTPTPAVDLTGFVNGDILGITAGKIAPVKLDTIFPIVPFIDAKRGSFRTNAAGTTISNISADLTALGITITGSLDSGFIQLVFSGSSTFWLHGGLYEDAFTQQHFQVGISFGSNTHFDLLSFVPTTARTFSDGSTGYNFIIFYYIL